MSEWISVDDKLPEAWRCVLTFRKDMGVYQFEHVTSDGVWVGDDTSFSPVTHWMPLPEPPKED